MITTIIFDIGNVLADFTWREHFASFGYDEKMVDRIARATVQSPEWNEYDRGVLTDEEILAGFIENDPEIADDIYKVLKNVKTIVKRICHSLDSGTEGKRLSLPVSVQFFPQGRDGVRLCTGFYSLSGWWNLVLPR